ncbi:TerC family protein [Blattabacterium cuenoti]|uniref:TerC family protein n=1 Tax=Blattabacterium cuenoti TaxID=1653831 RepID=UPI00163BF018|nr:DUF475 domain-containing protein [Blattabacterium cuenoti]
MNNDFIANDIKNIINHPIVSISILGNIFLIESILSIDNAVLLASMIMDHIKKKDRKKAIKYGIFGAYFFRSICLIFTYQLIKIWWLKLLGGIYLIYLGSRYFFSKFSKKNYVNNKKNIKRIDSFWKILIIIEIMDLAFSIDNIFAVIALSENLILIFLGVFAGILSMRWVTQIFVKLMEKNSFLKDSAFYVIIILGIKLIFSFLERKYHFYILNQFLIYFEKFFPFFTVIIFLFPIFISYFFPIPKKKHKNS